MVDQGQQPEIRGIGRYRDAHSSFAALAMWRRQRRVAAQPLRDGAGFEQWLVLEGSQEAVLNQLPGESGRARAGRGVADPDLDTQVQRPADLRREHVNRVRLPAREALGHQCRAANQQVEIQAHPGIAAFAILMAVDHLLQQRKETCRRHRRSLPPGVQQAIQPGHVNAFDVRCRQVDLDIRPGV
ncbi:hypothetical protein D3C80_1482680 [compost metagenome]